MKPIRVALGRVATLGAVLSTLVVSVPGPARAEAALGQTGASSLDDLRTRYNPVLARGLLRLRASQSVGEEHIVGDSTDAAGMHWTKCTNLGLDLLATLVAEDQGLMTSAEAAEHVRRLLEVLGGLRNYHGIFPEIILLDDGPRSEIKGGRIRYSSIDSAWVTVALTLVEARYQPRAGGGKDAAASATASATSADLANRAAALVSGQDYGAFVGANGLLGAGFWVDARTYQIVESFGFSYGDRNSEARPLVLALVGLGKLPSSAFDNMRTTWTMKEGLPVIEGWQSSAFVEMTGELWLDEMALAPLSLGQSHTNYLEATTRVARRLGHAVWGYAPACDLVRGYSEYGLDRAELVSPYAGGLLSMTGDPRAVANLERILAGLSDDGRPLPDGLDPRTGRVTCEVARTLDQSLLFLSLNVEIVRALARRTTWYASAEKRTRALDQSTQPPSVLRTATPAGTGRLPGVLAAAQGFDAAEGGPIYLARSELQLASATTTRAWTDFLPDLGLGLRHPLETSLFDPSWRLILQANTALSLDKLWTARAAGDGENVAEAVVRGQERAASVRALEGYFALFLAERKLRWLGEHRASLGGFASGLATGGKSVNSDTSGISGKPGISGARDDRTLDDLVLLRARLSTVDAAIAEAEAGRQLALAHLRTRTGSEALTEGTGLDAHLDLVRTLDLIGQATLVEPGATDEARATAEIAQQTSLVARAESRAAYVPELRAGAFVDIPRADATSSTASATGSGAGATDARGWAFDRVTGALSLAFDLRPGQGAAREAEQRALDNRRSRLDLVRQARAARIVEARIRLRARLGAWSSHPEAVTEALYRDAGERLKLGEVDVAVVIAASRALVDSWTAVERDFGEAVSAGIALASEGVRPQPEIAGAAPGGPSPGEAEAPGGASGLGPAELRAVDAETARARAEATRVRRDSWRLGIEAGVAYPLYTRAGATFDETIGSPMTVGMVALGTERIREPTLLGRLSLALEGNRAAEQAAGAEVELRAAEGEMAKKRYLAAQAAARMDLAYARTLASAAAGHAEFCAEQLRLARQMQSQGLTDDKNAVREAELRALLARSRSLEARAAEQEATVRTNQLLGRPLGAPSSIDETPEALLAWLRQTHYPSQGLVGFRSELGARVAELDQRRAQARLRALREPPSGVDLTVQATEQLRGYGRSVGVAIGLRLDPVRNTAQLLEAARLAGEGQGRIRGESERIEAERRVASAELKAAARAQAQAVESRERLAGILEDLRKNQAMRPELDASSKGRSEGLVEAQLQEVELAGIEAGARRARAELATLELEVPGQPSARAGTARGMPSDAPPATDASDASVDSMVNQLMASDPELDAAAGAARSVVLEAEHQPPALLAGLHLAGPLVGASYGIGRSPAGPATTLTERDGGAFLAMGASESFAESLASLGTGHQVLAAAQTSAAIRERTAARALVDLGRLWGAREQSRQAARIAAEHRRRLDDLAIPRYHAAQISAEELARTAASAAGATTAAWVAADREHQQRAALATRGVTVSDQVLDELARRAAPESVEAANARLASREQTELGSGAVLMAARERWEAARAETGLAYARLLGPATLLLELDPQRRRTGLDVGGLDGGVTDTTRRLTWVSSLFVPLRLKALGEGAEAGARAEVRRAETASALRTLAASFGEMRLGLALASNTFRATERARRDAGLAFAEADRRYRGALGGADSESHAQAEDDLFAAEKQEREARGTLTTLLAPLQEHPIP